VKAGRLVWVPDDGERGIVLAVSQDHQRVLVCFAAWKNGASHAVIDLPDELMFASGGKRVRPHATLGWQAPFLLPVGTFLQWYPVEHCVFDTPEPFHDRAGWCREAYPEDERLLP
jgi:hypothetical protein